MNAIEMIAAERRRQVEKERWSAEHDDKLGANVLAKAAACYAMPEDVRDKSFSLHYKMTPRDVIWPFDDDFWKPEGDRVRELVKAGALIVAEIEKMQRGRVKLRIQQGIERHMTP